MVMGWLCKLGGGLASLSSVSQARLAISLNEKIKNSFNRPMLEIELVPKTCWFSNVRDHVSKAEWDALRKGVYKKANHICEICGGRGQKWPVECHEIWHYNDENLTQTLQGLIALCPSCHEVKHIGLAGLRGRGEIARAHLEKINRWTGEQSEKYLDLVWEIWAERSKCQWQLNLAWLEQFGVYVEPKR
jgi:5-methylcytosine-specific restriction endonuclease McrA